MRDLEWYALPSAESCREATLTARRWSIIELFSKSNEPPRSDAMPPET